MQTESMLIDVKTALTRLYGAQNLQEERFTLKFKDLEIYGEARSGEELFFEIPEEIRFYENDLPILKELIKSRVKNKIP